MLGNRKISFDWLRNLPFLLVFGMIVSLGSHYTLKRPVYWAILAGCGASIAFFGGIYLLSQVTNSPKKTAQNRVEQQYPPIKVDRWYEMNQEEMPYAPREMQFPRYALWGTLGSSPAEELAARMITFSQAADRWVGVSWTQIVKMFNAERQAGVQRAADARVHRCCAGGRLLAPIRAGWILER